MSGKTPVEKEEVLRAEQLRIGYKSRRKTDIIASGISFAALKGELTAIIGANGMGKTTLLRTLARILPAISGNITLHRKPLGKFSASGLAREIGLVLTGHHPSGNLTVNEIIALGRHPYTNWMGTPGAEDRAKVDEAKKLLGIEPLGTEKCYTLSDGQLQKVMIARVIAQDTSVIILDEPTTHLDVYHKTHILKLLRTLAHKTGKSIIFSSHEIEHSIQLCDKILVLHRGGADFGTPQSLVRNGTFNRLFPEDLITFDPETTSFRIRE
ncbi:ABC transporter ATP-binding protein [Sinomicrobium soli]|uniref:ABC transporter ATP-binding protein n=1 Tax=Sinomicrobium sp. N-1-3-6 TaxID=2219864 RepID=UPI000DCB56AE|nr:ABC transporter ATP-binding protein [Sinomicrobium sp. N-1-3-6]RAV30376.1 ABC transporter ATP-binding protein [Sinomicrobium sp. N-1-3-6]